MRRVRKRRMQEVVELNITAFLNLMVILVPFLLITAVFSRMTVLELNLPALNAKQKDDQPIKLQLQLLVKPESLSLQDNTLGLIKRIDRGESGLINWKVLNRVLIEIKTRFPEEQGITLLITPDVHYKTMIEIMDHVRYTDIVNVTTLETVELFPNVSIGDAVMGEVNNDTNTPTSKEVSE